MPSYGIVSVLLAVVIAGALFGPFVSAVSSNTGVQTVTNETITASTGEYVDLEGYTLNESSVRVFNTTDELVAGEDYEVGAQNGSILALSGGSISDGESIDVSYRYAITEGPASTIADLIPLLLLVTIIGILGFAVRDQASGGRGGI
jgi:hypothetical protein